jgi:hypothetical protein
MLFGPHAVQKNEIGALCREDSVAETRKKEQKRTLKAILEFCPNGTKDPSMTRKKFNGCASDPVHRRNGCLLAAFSASVRWLTYSSISVFSSTN